MAWKLNGGGPVTLPDASAGQLLVSAGLKVLGGVTYPAQNVVTIDPADRAAGTPHIFYINPDGVDMASVITTADSIDFDMLGFWQGQPVQAHLTAHRQNGFGLAVRLSETQSLSVGCVVRPKVFVP